MVVIFFKHRLCVFPYGWIAHWELRCLLSRLSWWHRKSDRTRPNPRVFFFQSMSVSAKNRISNLYVDTLLLFIICRHSILLYLYVYELCTQLRLTTVFKEYKMRWDDQTCCGCQLFFQQHITLANGAAAQFSCCSAKLPFNSFLPCYGPSSPDMKQTITKHDLWSYTASWICGEVCDIEEIKQQLAELRQTINTALEKVRFSCLRVSPGRAETLVRWGGNLITVR